MNCTCGATSIVIAEREAPGAVYRVRQCTSCDEVWPTLDLSKDELAALTGKRRKKEPARPRIDVQSAYESFRARSDGARNGRRP